MMNKNFRQFLLLIAAVIMISLSGCDPSRKLEKEEREQISEYLGKHPDMNFVLQESGLYYLETLAGTGASAVLLDSAFVRYTGKFLTGAIFDSNVATGKLYGFIVGQNIEGFDEGVLLMKVGGKATLLIPSSLAYGTQGSYPYISGYKPLLFELELVKVKAASAK
jgi:FKBP-type peptidyl-prolyl cis-trans isomerase